MKIIKDQENSEEFDFRRAIYLASGIVVEDRNGRLYLVANAYDGCGEQARFVDLKGNKVLSKDTQLECRPYRKSFKVDGSKVV